jgi:hypothetical protein
MSLAHYRVSAPQSDWHAFRSQSAISKGRLAVLSRTCYQENLQRVNGLRQESLPVGNAIATLERELVLAKCC